MEKRKSAMTPAKQAELAAEYDRMCRTEELSFVIEGKPEPYARARFARAGRFVHCYNPKASIEDRYRAEMKGQIPQGKRKGIEALLADEGAEYSVSVSCDFYVPISESDSLRVKALKESGRIKPCIRNGDIDNYVKLVLDAMHGVAYNDDKLVTSIDARKMYSTDPRSEIRVRFLIHDKGPELL